MAAKKKAGTRTSKSGATKLSKRDRNVEWAKQDVAGKRITTKLKQEKSKLAQIGRALTKAEKNVKELEARGRSLAKGK